MFVIMLRNKEAAIIITGAFINVARIFEAGGVVTLSQTSRIYLSYNTGDVSEFLFYFPDGV